MDCSTGCGDCGCDCDCEAFKSVEELVVCGSEAMSTDNCVGNKGLTDRRSRAEKE